MGAALLLCGCGGGDSDSPSTAASTAVSTEATTAGKEGSELSPQAKAQAKAAKQGAAQARSGEGTPGGGDPSGQGQKHGAHIAQPKGAPEQAPAPAEIAAATVADMSLQSPAITASGGAPGSLPTTYTCDGKGGWPELRWQGVPPGTAELALYVMNVQPVQEKLFVDWAVAGLDPDLSAIEAGALPKGAIVGTNSFGKRGYEICPPGSGEIYMFAIYALPQKLSPPKGFDARELRKEILGVSGNVGLLPALYARG